MHIHCRFLAALGMTGRSILAALGMTVAAASLGAQNAQRHFTEGVDARFARAHPVIHYRVTLSDTDTTGYNVAMSIRNARDTFRIAMAKHPEYDDTYFRQIDTIDAGGRVTVAREDSTVWRIVAPGGEALLEYRVNIRPEARPRAAWRPFMSPTGALTGGPHTFMYVVGSEMAPAHVQVIAPTSWSISTGLTPTADPRTFFASNAYVLVESPILTGHYRSSTFTIDGVPHTIVYWPAPTARAFDTTAFRDGVERMTRETVKLFGRPAYREYIFQFQDQAWGGLEHHNSVTLGARSDLLAQSPHALLPETAHEFIHTWNLMRIRPAEYVGVTYKQIAPVPTLWFSEGLTIFYSDLMIRRAGLPTSEATRVERLQSILARYLSMPGNARFSAEQIGRVAYNARPDALGDYVTSAHLQGEVLGNMLDLIIRDATNGRSSMDDVMRLLVERTAGPRGMTGADIEQSVADVCKCVVKPFFDTYVRGAKALDYNRYLGLIGLRATDTTEQVVRESQPVPDHRLWAWTAPGDTLLSLLVNNPTTIWGQAGLHSGERLITFNGNSVRTWPEFRQALSSTRIGDVVHLVVKPRGTAEARTVTVTVKGHDRPVVRIEEIPTATEKQVRLREAWLAGSPTPIVERPGS
jgi:predicted metalloprotease with PDZ domain